MTFNATAPTQTYTYDQENRLTGAAGYIYTYDGDGNRVRKSNGNTPSSGTLYWYMTPGVVAESDLAGTLKSEYVFFDGERVARKDFPGNTVAYYFSDHLKTASVITNASGTINAESDYYPWGGELQFINNDQNDYKFTGKKRDTETGLDYFGARYYSSGLGRWISADWSATPVPVPYADLRDPQSFNLYGFVGGNPASKADPDGHDWPSLSDIGNLIVGAGNAYGSDFFLGAGRVDSDNKFYQAGQAIGDGVSLIHSVGETEIGIVGDIVGIPLIPAGGSGLLVESVSVGVTAHGAVRGSVSAVNLGRAIVNAFSQKGTDPGSRPGKDLTPAGKKEVDARDGNQCHGDGCSQTVKSVKNTRGEPTPSDQRQRHHINPKSKGGSGTPENIKTLCPECHKEEHRKMREQEKGS